VELTRLFGLPAHPLVVHLPIVLIPLTAGITVAMAVRPAWRARFGWLTVGLAGVALAGVQLAISSGDALEQHVQRTAVLRRHTQLADSMRPLTFVMFVFVLAFVTLASRPRDTVPRAAVAAVALLASVSGLATTARLVQVGHNGARASWGDVNMSSRRTGQR
jgi:uncharacterized membrane protein